MLKVLKSGFFTTIQDGGRYGYLNKGVPVSGFMDTFSAYKVNLLLENETNAALIETTMTGPTLEFGKSTYICLGGAQLSVTLNNEPIQDYKVYKVEKGDKLSYGKLEKGFRSYLGVKDGFVTPKILGSQSLYLPITSKNHLEDGSSVDYSICEQFKSKTPELKVDSFLSETILTVTHGPEFHILSKRQLEGLFFKDFKISNQNDRMAYQIEEKIIGHKVSMLTSATLPGTVQLTPSGKLIILMKDGQTTGGYPRVLQLTDRAISILAQKKFGDKVSFKLI
ncbi:biotin-dependent carboxyltransferase family protein [uncultured Kriegella sp.]|uniref:5-oxoprolinase subunit C family protein n=1 Tax=uncultured Kriegella sp. TaxID=1798910 RepID=UPI0030D946D7|tara:strand:+ start:371580 stop:372419 length:840 start_codon:yes stop_codon:yes gene_type:complete